MDTISRAAFAVSVTLLASAPAGAQTPDMKALMQDAARWIAQNTDYKELQAPPRWAELTDQQMKGYAINAGHDGGSVFAVYNCPSQTMFFRSDADLSRIGVQSFIVHEVVHHGQCVNNHMQRDACGKEREAYTLQAKWLREKARLYTAPTDRDWVNNLADAQEKRADLVCERLKNR